VSVWSLTSSGGLVTVCGGTQGWDTAVLGSGLISLCSGRRRRGLDGMSSTEGEPDPGTAWGSVRKSRVGDE
jgi:hypothetical protein